MNIILFDEIELEKPLSLHDPRGRHMRKVLRAQVGDTIRVGIINGAIGHAEITRVNDHGYTLSFRWTELSLPLNPIQLLIGHPRPQIMRRILRDCASLGVMSIHFPLSELGEKSYFNSHIWENDTYRHHIREGVEQSGSTLFPTVHKHISLKQCFNSIHATEYRIAPDNDVSVMPIQTYLKTLPECIPEVSAVPSEQVPLLTLAIGPERGWTDIERDMLQSEGYQLVSMGNRILRTDTACVTGLALILSRLGVLS